MKQLFDNESWRDNFIREVRVNYVASDTPTTKFTGPADIARLVRSILIDNSCERFVAMYLDASQCIASYSSITIGTANQSLVHPREPFQRAILVGCYYDCDSSQSSLWKYRAE